MDEYKVWRNSMCLTSHSHHLGIPRFSKQVEDRTRLKILSAVSVVPFWSRRYSPQSRWYNVPPSGSGTTGTGAGLELPSSIHERREGHAMPMLEHDSVPLNFNTFVPSHDPALPNLAARDTQNLAGISQDEAFQNALNAMYWTGYWTAVCHVRVSLSIPSLMTDHIPSVVAPQMNPCLKRRMTLDLVKMSLRVRMWTELWTSL